MWSTSPPPRPTEDGTRQTVQAEAGSYDSRSLSYGLTHKQGALENTLNLSHFFTNGFSAAAAGTEADGAETNRASATLRYQVNGTLALGGAVFRQQGNSEFDAIGADAANRKKASETGARAFAELSLGNTEHVFDVTHYRIGRDVTDSSGLSTFDGSRTTFGWQGTTELGEALTLVYGADTMLETGRYSNLPTGSAETRLSGAFAQALWTVNGQLDVSATARVDRNSDFGNFETGRIALAWRPDGATTVRAALATGYRAPSIDERFGNYPDPRYPFVGNPTLTPEESLSYELGLEREFANGATVSATHFQLDVDNQIAYASCPLQPLDPLDPNSPWVCMANTVSTLNNIPGKSVRKGVELAANLPLGDRANLELAYTYTDARRQTGARIGLVPRHELVLRLQGDLTDRISAGATVKHAADRLNDFAFAAMPDYTVVGVDASYQVNDLAEAYIRIENLFDEDYQTSEGYGTAGRSAFVGLRANF